MSAKIPLRTDYDAVQARALARKATDPNQVRRLLAIAAVYDDMNRRDAAAVGGMDHQSLRDWVYRFNQAGPEGLHDHKSPGAVPQLTAVERVALREPGVMSSALKAWPMGLWIGLTGIVASACWYTAFTLQNASYVMALGQIELVFTYAASRLVFKERMTAAEAVGVGLTIAGILAVVLFG